MSLFGITPLQVDLFGTPPSSPMINPIQKWFLVDGRRLIAAALLALLGLCGLAFWNQLGGLGLMDKTEGLFVEIPRQMLLSGDWVTPRWNGNTFFDYPVWGYWMVALSFKLFGITEWAARVPTALAATITVLALFAVVLRLSPTGEPLQNRVARATLAGSLLTLSPGWIGWARSSVTDIFLASAISLALFGFLLAYLAESNLRQRAFGHAALAIFSGIAVMAKGPVGVLLPGLVIICFLLLKGQLFSQIRSTPWLPMGALFLGVILPWYGAATQANGWEFLQRFIGYSNFQRFTSVIYSHPGPPWFYLPWLFLLLLPWSLFLPVALSRLHFWRLETWRKAASVADIPLFSGLWLFLILLFFSTAATKLAGYILPVLPAAALVVSLLFQPFQAEVPLGRGMRISGWINAALFSIAAVMALVLPSLLQPSPDFPLFNGYLISALSPIVFCLALVLFVVLFVLLLSSPGRLQLIWLPNALAMFSAIAFVIPATIPIVDRERLKPVRELARIAGRLSETGQPLIVVGFKRYSTIFYSNKQALFVGRSDEVLGAYRNFKLRSQYASPNPLSESQSPPSILLLGTVRELSRFGLPFADGPNGCELIAQRNSLQLVSCALSSFTKLSPNAEDN